MDSDDEEATNVEDSGVTLQLMQDEVVQKERPKPLIEMVPVDLLRDSLDDNILQSLGFESELAQRVKSGELPEETLCKDRSTGETISVVFDYSMSRCYLDPETKQYYRPINAE